MASWYVDKGLGTLIAQERQKHPGLVVGTIGDEAHRKRKSAHNPEADGSVDAGDFMLKAGVFTEADCDSMVNALVRNWDRRLRRIIWKRRTISEDNRSWRPYSGDDPHTGHAHVEMNDDHENDNSPWNLGGIMYEYTPLTGVGLPVLKRGDDDDNHDGYNAVSRAQVLLNYLGAKLTVDGNYGPLMQAAVKAEFDTDGKTITIPMWHRLAGLSKAV